MQKMIVRLFQIWFKTIEIILPFVAKKWAVNLFFTPLRYPVPARENHFAQQATVKKVNFTIDPHELYNPEYAHGKVLNKKFNNAEGKDYYNLYELGEGPLVLLVHGWSGRASQLGLIARTFVKNGYKVITFDAFAHGNSPGKQTTVLEFIKIIKNITKTYGPFKAMIGHSLGGIACGKSIIEGVKTEKLITIGSPTTFQYLLDAFGQIINAAPRTTEYIKEFIENYAKAEVDKYSLATIGKDINVPGLIIHDRDDKDAKYEQALLLDEVWKDGKLITTQGLGHSRILRNKKVIQTMVDFIAEKETVEI